MAEFEWDDDKNESNKIKHGVSLEKARETFNDPYGVTYRSKSQSELRFIRVGKTFGKVLLSVIYTFRSTVIRIISARTPRKNEIKDYLKNSLSQQSNRNEED
jgi:hypothetical protein